MAGEIYISMTGYGNELWKKCLSEKLVALGFEKPYFDAWNTGDYESYLTIVRADANLGLSESDIKTRATLWYRRATRLVESEADIWLHRDGADLYWAETTSEGAIFESYDDKVMIAKPVTGWSTRNRKTVSLTWNSIHPKAKDYMVTQQAIFRVASPDMKDYLWALIDGEDLTPWHNRTDWVKRLGEGKSLGKNVELSEKALTRMMLSIKDTVKNSNGQLVLKTLKDKKLLCSEAEMKSHLAQLMEEQQGLCKITKLPMHLDSQDGMEIDMLASADRIDSNGHYEIGNVQLVCRFVNFWKSAQENNRFVELLNRVISRHRELEVSDKFAET